MSIPCTLSGSLFGAVIPYNRYTNYTWLWCLEWYVLLLCTGSLPMLLSNIRSTRVEPTTSSNCRERSRSSGSVME
ncbi:hypothetical protein GGTG_07620 [Gaeumannomyces tritici R3-111a-1]|uniref:Uncharacterized protein n=1 Tax=Gaeumannomyces tritici (strain R3-111a-1) TaxID=644352 RepID=J3P272_GAET3|nr:hypothetical protein GGTG_07620 [Gaeumannomyces tritici R3-111a-1]EJT73764.1 hypothetical protein GGTG_07620 [Gaeumannomyces tritici R3-111a-1]